jgi:outer membrane protein assembly factor BamB
VAGAATLGEIENNMLNKRMQLTIILFLLALAATVMIALFAFLPGKKDHPAEPAPALKKAVPNINWPVFRGNQNLSGFADAGLADEFELAWTFTTGAVIESVPIINKETIFASSADGKIYALGRDKGDLIWEFDSGAPIEASALYFKNTVYAGNRNGVLYALDAGTGREKWKYATGNKITGSANYAEISEQQYIILIGSYDNAMHALDANTGKQLWEYTAKSYINGAPSVFKNSLAFGGCDSFLRILEVGTGKEIAGVEMGSYIASSVCYFEGNIYLAHYGGNIVCFSLQENKILWQYPKDSSLGPFLGSPAVNMEKVVIGSQDKKLYAVNRFTGELVWTFDTKGEVKSSPVIFASKVVAGSSDGRLYILNLDDGSLLWSYEIGAEISGFAVTGGMIIAAAGTGVYAFKSDFVRAQNSKSQFRNH